METEIPESYQQTDAGLIPVEWQAKKLSELFKFKNGVNAEKKHYGKGIKFINVLEVIQKNSLFYDDIPGFISLDTESIKSNLVQKGDILFNRTSETQEEIGLTAVYLDDKEVVFGGFVIRARPINDEIDCHFSKYGFSSRTVRNQIIKKGQGAVRANIGQSDLKEIFIPLPPLPEQKAIAQSLSDVDALIAALDRLITKKRNIKQGTMQQLLTGKKRLPGFRGEWEVKKLEKVAPLQRGFDLPNSQLVKGNYPVVYSNGILNFHNKYQAKAPGVVTGRSGTIGKVTFVEEDYWPHNTSLWVTDFKANAPKFIYYLYVFIGLERFGTGSGVPTLNRNDVHAFQIPLPPTQEEQQAIAQILSDMDAEITVLEQKRNKYKAIKQGMMQELLTGKTRVIDQP
jgi:type I restriction enzyme S subunit